MFLSVRHVDSFPCTPYSLFLLFPNAKRCTQYLIPFLQISRPVLPSTPKKKPVKEFFQTNVISLPTIKKKKKKNCWHQNCHVTEIQPSFLTADFKNQFDLASYIWLYFSFSQTLLYSHPLSLDQLTDVMSLNFTHLFFFSICCCTYLTAKPHGDKLWIMLRLEGTF